MRKLQQDLLKKVGDIINNISTVYNDVPLGCLNPSRAFVWSTELSMKLEELMKLEQGWDGYDACPVSFDVAFFVSRVLENICFNQTPKPSVIPGSKGDLQIEWHINGYDIELHIIKPYHIEAVVYSEEENFEKEFTLSSDYKSLLPYIEKISQSLTNNFKNVA